MYKPSNSLLYLSFAASLYLSSLISAQTTAVHDANAAMKKVVSLIGAKSAGVPYFSPLDGGGSQLDIVFPGFGEPMNVIISALSDPQVLTNGGFLNWAQSVDESSECLGIHLGGPQQADLGDGHGPVNQTMELRHDFGDEVLGTCLESLIGGNHLRMFRQNGPQANSGALFLAVSIEKDVKNHHDIVPNGYDLGRDALVALALNHGGTTFNNGVEYKATSQNITGLLTPGTKGVNHGIAIDGVVVLLTIQIVSD